MSALERRYRHLLRAYPSWYRADRGDEMLGTLLEVRDHGWPSAREARKLILGGLRVRAGQNQRQGFAGNLRLVALFAAVLTLVPYAARDLRQLNAGWGIAFPPIAAAWVGEALGLLTLAAIAVAWSGRRFLARVIALLAVGLTLYQVPDRLLPRVVVPVLALLVIAILVSGTRRLPPSWAALAGALFVMLLLPVSAVGEARLIFYALICGTIIWAMVDVRPLAAFALWLAVVYGAAALQSFALFGLGLVAWAYWLPAIASLAVAIVAVWRLRRQAVL